MLPVQPALFFSSRSAFSSSSPILPTLFAAKLRSFKGEKLFPLFLTSLFGSGICGWVFFRALSGRLMMHGLMEVRLFFGGGVPPLFVAFRSDREVPFLPFSPARCAFCFCQLSKGACPKLLPCGSCVFTQTFFSTLLPLRVATLVSVLRRHSATFRLIWRRSSARFLAFAQLGPPLTSLFLS